MHADIVAHFIMAVEDLNKFSSRPNRNEYLDVVINSKELKERFRKIYQVINKQRNAIDQLYEDMKSAVGLVLESQRRLYVQTHQNFRINRKNKENFVNDQNKERLFDPSKRQAVLAADFVGAKKFFLYQQIVEQSLGSKLRPWNYQQLFNQFLSYQELYRKVEWYSWKVLNLIPLAVGYPVSEYPNSLWEEYGIKKNESFIREISECSLQRICSSDFSSMVRSSCLSEEHDVQMLILDLNQRKITLLNGQLTEGQTGLLATGVKITDHRLGLVFSESSPVKKENLSKIPKPFNVKDNQDFGKYDLAVKKLLDHFFVSLDLIVAKEPIPESNTFATIAKSSRTVPSLTGDLPSLIFPTEFIMGIEKRFIPLLPYMEATDSSTLINYYDFSLETLELTLHFKHLHLEDKLRERNFCVVTIAKFDAITVDAFKKSLTSPMSKDQLSEFLIQAMYSGFADIDLGLPSQGTIVLDNFIAPQEITFPGLYQLWELCPHKMIDYHANRYTQDISDKIDNADFVVELFKEFPPVKLDNRCYLDIWIKTQKSKEALQQQEKEYEKNYHVLFGLVKLFSSVSNEVLEEYFKTYLGVYSPDQFEQQFEQWIEATDEPKLNVEKYAQLLDALKHQPSRHVLKFKEQEDKLKEYYQKFNLDN